MTLVVDTSEDSHECFFDFEPIIVYYAQSTLLIHKRCEFFHLNICMLLRLDVYCKVNKSMYMKEEHNIVKVILLTDRILSETYNNTYNYEKL